jgi:hypothetical protein
VGEGLDGVQEQLSSHDLDAGSRGDLDDELDAMAQFVVWPLEDVWRAASRCVRAVNHG